MAQGDYPGAVEAYLKLAESGTEASHYTHAAKVCVEKLQDPDRALDILSTALYNREWDKENWCLLQFRFAESLLKYKQDFNGAKACLNDIMTHCPDTRHSANARALCHEIEVQMLTNTAVKHPIAPPDGDEPRDA